TMASAEDLKPFRALLLSYEGQKPLDPAYHTVLRDWVAGGGRLLYVGDGGDPYHHVAEWWNEQGATERTARDALLETLGVSAGNSQPQRVGEGLVVVVDRSPSALTRDKRGDDRLLRELAALLEIPRSALKTSPY